MNTIFETYQTRKIDYRTVVKINDWNIKVYTITNKKTFQSERALEGFLNKLPELIEHVNSSSLPTYKVAFAIVHEAREGVLILLNWWTGGEMVETEIYFSDYLRPGEIVSSPFKDKALVCIWEIEIFAHERKAWIAHVLSAPDQPDFEAYLSDGISLH